MPPVDYSKVTCNKLLAAFLLALPLAAQVNRVVIIKVDGLPEGLVEQYASENGSGARAGRSRLPWIDHVFAQNGVWMENFYVRGMSLSAPSWSLLDTGRHLEVRGNAEYDRYTLRVFDYLNFFPFYVGYARLKQADMPGVELLDSQGVPLLIDRFPFDQRFQSFQLYQRGVHWKTLEDSLSAKFGHRPVKDIFDEWVTGLTLSSSVGEQLEHELIRKLNDPDVHYLDFFTGDFDHTAHLTNDRVALFHVIESLDSLIGRVWTAIQASPLAKTTMLVVVSDHGMNTSPGIYSQGYDLISWFNSAAGGGHHVLTNRHPMTEFKLKGLDPFVSEVISPSTESTYLAGDSARYPTCVLDLDGNERANISLRNSDLNVIQILLDQLIHKKVSGRLRIATIDALFETINRVRPEWQRNVNDLAGELRELRASIESQQRAVDVLPRRWTKQQEQAGMDLDAKRQVARLDHWKEEERTYSEYVATMRRLLALDPADFDPGKFRMEDLIPKRSLGEPNSLYDLQNYAVGPAQTGMVLNADGRLDLEHSIRRIDYFPALSSIAVRNVVQKGVGAKPVDFLAVALKDRVWLWKSDDAQALILTRRDEAGRLELRYLPVARLTQDQGGELHYDAAPWSAGLPLEMFEDPQLDVPGDRTAWLDQWHDERDWLRAVHRTKYSNGIIGLVEQLLSEPVSSPFRERERELRRADLLAVANDHWNFNVRGFNPGGNHGSFLRISTHSVLMFAGGEDTGIPRGLRVTEPYDSLSFVPTILTLMGRPEPDLPGPMIREMIETPGPSTRTRGQ